VLQQLNVFDELAKPLRDAIVERGFVSPTEPQLQAIPEILAGRNVLLISPTASGKTEAAVLPVLSKYIADRGEDRGIKILYITPLRALNRDMLDRFEWWGKRLDVRIAVRHGDTEVKERSLQAKNPPDMLIITPETLQAGESTYNSDRTAERDRYSRISNDWPLCNNWDTGKGCEILGWKWQGSHDYPSSCRT
jgi:Lhr-like helicase